MAESRWQYSFSARFSTIPVSSRRPINLLNPLGWPSSRKSSLMLNAADPAAVRHQVERLGERERRDVAEAEERRNRHERVEAVRAQLAPARSRQRGQVEHAVVVVDAGAVALGGRGGLGQQVDADDRGHAEVRELLAHHAVAGAQVEHTERRRGRRPAPPREASARPPESSTPAARKRGTRTGPGSRRSRRSRGSECRGSHRRRSRDTTRDPAPVRRRRGTRRGAMRLSALGTFRVGKQTNSVPGSPTPKRDPARVQGR